MQPKRLHSQRDRSLNYLSIKRWYLVSVAVACLIMLFSTAALQASPWVEPDDQRARHALQKLADRRHIDRTVTTWPIMWGSVDAALAEGNPANMSSVANSLAYLQFERDIQAAPGFKAELSLAGTTDPAFIRGFGGTPRETGTANLNVQWQGEAWALGLSPAYAVNPEDDQSFRLDGSYLAATAGNWVLGAGAIDRWWGPGWQSSLVLSTNARPIPAVWLNRKIEQAPATAWLQWIGPWQFTLFAGQLEEERAVPDANLVGMRLTFRPIDGLDIGLSRTIQIGGEGRPDSASTYWDALIGRDNGQDGQENDPGNQLGSIDLRYGFPIGSQSMSVYGQMMGEDEAGTFPAKKTWLLGSDWTTQLGAHDQQWFLEYTNTTAEDFLGDALPNITYEHHNYRTGYRYDGRNMASTFEGDASAITLGGYNFFSDGRNLGASISYAELNQDGQTRTVVPAADIVYSIPSSNQKIAQATLSYGQPFLAGWLDLNARATDKEIELIGGEKDRWSVGAQWRYRF